MFKNDLNIFKLGKNDYRFENQIKLCDLYRIRIILIVIISFIILLLLLLLFSYWSIFESIKKTFKNRHEEEEDMAKVRDMTAADDEHINTVGRVITILRRLLLLLKDYL